MMEGLSALADILSEICIIRERRVRGRKQIVYISFFIKAFRIFKADVFLKALTKESFCCIQICLCIMSDLIEPLIALRVILHP